MITLGYPTAEEELSIVENQRFTHPIQDLQPVATVEQIIELQETVKQVFVDDLIKQYAVAIVGEDRRGVRRPAVR